MPHADTGLQISISGVVAVSCLHNQLFVLGHCKLDAVKPSGCRSGVGRVTKAVLRAKLFCNLRIDRGRGLLARDFEHAAAGFAGDLFQDLLAVGVILAPSLTSPGEAPATAKAAATMATVPVLLAFEVNGVDHSLGPLCRRDGAAHDVSVWTRTECSVTG